ncbi:MAG: hypothetical protein QNK18_18510 [Gammaproteobacteria bacterium]|nr:hypothetical protein [Gammaproteobacteria bacterium]
MSVINPNVRFTYQDYRSLRESMDKRYELLHGKLLKARTVEVNAQDRECFRLIKA